MNYLETNLCFNVELPFSLIHVSDTHLCLVDDRNDQRKQELSLVRDKIFPEAADCLLEIEKHAKKSGSIIVHTGDLIDFVSEANLDAAKKFTDNNDVFMTAGNHEFSQYVGEAVEDEAYRNQSLSKVQAVFKNDIRFCSRIVNGINLVGIDNSYYRFEPEQLDALKAEVQRGIPIILFMHCPFYEEKLYDIMMSEQKSACLCTAPEDKMKLYPENRYIQQRADAITVEATDYILNEPVIKAIFTGHLHFDYECELNGKMQYTTGKTSIRKINIR